MRWENEGRGGEKREGEVKEVILERQEKARLFRALPAMLKNLNFTLKAVGNH